jgi:predicted metal-dependent phosphoesterase TrpH
MDLVTVTDHDQISGAMALAHYPDVIAGSEVTGTFPGDGVRVHLDVLGLDERRRHETSYTASYRDKPQPVPHERRAAT